MSLDLYCGPIEFELRWQDKVKPTGLTAPLMRNYFNSGSPAMKRIAIELENPVPALLAAPPSAIELAHNWRVWAVGNGQHILQVWCGLTREYALEARLDRGFNRIQIRCLGSNPARNRLSFLLVTVTRWVVTQLAGELGGFLLHCAAVMKPDGSVIVGSGPSGVGKSTFSGFFRKRPGYQVLTDETALVIPGKDGFMAYGTPWHGMLMTGLNACGPLERVFYLEQAPGHAIRDVSMQESAIRLMREIFLPPWNAATSERVLDNALGFLAVVPQQILSFSKSKTIVDFIEERA